MACSQFVTGVEQPLAKLASSLGPGLIKKLYSRIRPDVSRAARMGYADDLAEAVRVAETQHLIELRAGNTTIERDLVFRGQRRNKRGAYVDNPDDGDVLAKIGTYFQEEVNFRRMVVLGGPGAGKTVAAISLALDLLSYRSAMSNERRARVPVPVRINLAGWDGKGSFAVWLAAQLSSNTTYCPHSRIAEKMIDSGQILPILDGLDEMDPQSSLPSRAHRVLEHLNRGRWKERSVVLTCRTAAYQRICAHASNDPDAGLHHAKHIELKPLTSNQVVEYLNAARTGRGGGIRAGTWAPVTKELTRQPDGELSAALGSPWLLSLTTVALLQEPKQTPQELCKARNRAEIQDVLFRSLIPAAIESGYTEKSGHYSEDEVRTWLCTLAQNLDRSDGPCAYRTLISLYQIWTMAGRRRIRIIHGIAVATAIAIAAVAAIGSHAIQAWGTPSFIKYWFVGFGLVPFVGVPLAVGMGVRSAVGSLGASRFTWRVRGRRRWPRGLRAGALTGLTVAALAVPWAWAMFALPGVVSYLSWAGLSAFRLNFLLIDALLVLPIGIGFGLLTGLAVGIISTFDTSFEDRLAVGQDAGQLVRDDWRAGAVFGLANACIFSFAAYLGANSASGSVPNGSQSAAASSVLQTSLLQGAFVGIVTALVVTRVTGRHIIASAYFTVTKSFAPRPAQFLDWGRGTGLLRVTGIAYQFRHDTYQKWLVGQSMSGEDAQSGPS